MSFLYVVRQLSAEEFFVKKKGREKITTLKTKKDRHVVGKKLFDRRHNKKLIGAEALKKCGVVLVTFFRNCI